MKRLTLWSLILLAGFVDVPAARAHFLFTRILPPAEGGRAAEVYFSELAEAGDPRFIDKVAHTELWLQRTPGKFEPLKLHKLADRLRAHLPANGSLMVVGACEYGVLARPKKTPFLLRHYPKALAGRPDELNKLTPHGRLPLEVVGIIEKDGVRLSVLVDGKPLPNAEFTTVDTQLANTRVRANEKGEAFWKPKADGFYSVYVSHTRKQAGELRGQKYEEIREFATLALAWPLQRSTPDPKAVALFEEAIAYRAEWHDFPGFEATIAGNLVGRPFRGAIRIDAKGEVTYSDADPSRQETVSSWVEEQFASMVLHRLARPKSADAKKERPVVRFADGAQQHPLGPLLIFEGGKFASSYRVKDRQILVVNRHLGKKNMTITILENDLNKEGKYLPRSCQVQYWDASTGRLLETDTVQSRWARVGLWDMPSWHRVATANDAGLEVRTFTLTEHKLLKAK